MYVDFVRVGQITKINTSLVSGFIYLEPVPSCFLDPKESKLKQSKRVFFVVTCTNDICALPRSLLGKT